MADRDAVRDEIARLWAFHEQRLHASVPPERLIDRVAFSQDPPIGIVQCAQCGHVYRNPSECRAALLTAYDHHEPSDDVFQSLFQTQRAAYAAQARRLIEVAGPAGRGLEVGSYVGGFLAAARDHGWAFEGVDVGRRAAAFAASHGLTVTHGAIDDVAPTRPYDVVAIWNTFEQLYDVRAAVHAAHERLRRGGILVVRVPNGRFYTRWRARLGGPLDAVAVRLLIHNNLLTFPYRQAFTATSMGRLLERQGFSAVRIFGDTLVPVADEWTTPYGAAEERVVKRVERLIEHGWQAPWVEVYARAGDAASDWVHRRRPSDPTGRPGRQAAPSGDPGTQPPAERLPASSHGTDLARDRGLP